MTFLTSAHGAAGAPATAQAPAHTQAPARAKAPLALRGQVDPGDPQAWQFRLTLDRPAPITLTCDEEGGRHERHRVQRAAATDHIVTLRGLKADTVYSCVAGTTDGSLRSSPPLRLKTAALPRGLIVPSITVPSGNLAQTGYTLYNYGLLLPGFKYASANLVILDAEGNVRWYYSGVGGGDIDATWLGGDRVLYAGWAGDYHVPTIVGLDKQVKFTATSSPTVPLEEPGTFNHDAGLSEDGKSIFALVQTFQDDTYRGFVVKQIDLATNRVVWFWDSEQEAVATGELPKGTADDWDPYHNNSVQDRWENGRLFVYAGLRDFHQLFKIDHATKDIVWRLGYDGDFTLLESDGRRAADHRWFFNQHDAQIDGNLVTVYDNGSDRSDYGGRVYSRVVQLEIDEVAHTARIVFEWTEDNWYEPAWGGYDLLPTGNSLVTLGHCQACGGTQHPSALIELDPQGRTAWRADWSNLRVSIYRSDRIDGCDIFSNTTYCPTLE